MIQKRRGVLIRIFRLFSGDCAEMKWIEFSSRRHKQFGLLFNSRHFVTDEYSTAGVFLTVGLARPTSSEEQAMPAMPVRPRETFTLTICGVQDIHTHTQRNAEASAANNESPAT